MFNLVVFSLLGLGFAVSGNAEQSQVQPSTQKIQKLGFKKMDVVHTVNGEQADSPQKAMELYNQMKADDVAVVERREPAAGNASEVKDWNTLLSKATPQEKDDLGKVLQQIRMVPAKDPATGKSVFKVMAVEKGSVFDREGVRAGDLVSTGG